MISMQVIGFVQYITTMGWGWWYKKSACMITLPNEILIVEFGKYLKTLLCNLVLIWLTKNHQESYAHILNWWKVFCINDDTFLQTMTYITFSFLPVSGLYVLMTEQGQDIADRMSQASESKHSKNKSSKRSKWSTNLAILSTKEESNIFSPNHVYSGDKSTSSGNPVSRWSLRFHFTFLSQVEKRAQVGANYSHIENIRCWIHWIQCIYTKRYC